MNKILGIDLGTNSIGWALRNPDLPENQIEKYGVLTFNKGVGVGKTGEFSYAAERTKKRSMRRLYQSRKYRLWSTLAELIKLDFCPLSIENLNKWRHYDKDVAQRQNNGGRVYPVDDIAFDQWIKLDFDGDGKPDYKSPYQLRKELAFLKLDFEQESNRYRLGRALYHIAQRRGFKSSRKQAGDAEAAEKDKEVVADLQASEKKKNKTIAELFDKYPEAKTIGWLYAQLEDSGKRIRESIAQHAIRENYKAEIKYIFETQQLGLEHPLFKALVETGYNRNDGSVFYKRPLRSQKGLIGKCTFEPGKYRAPVSHPDFELFRAWSFINNIKYRLRDENNSDWKELSLAWKQDIFEDKFFRKSKAYFSFLEIAEFVNKKVGRKCDFNFPLKTTVTGCPVSARLKDIFGSDYRNVKIEKDAVGKLGKNYYDLDDIWHVLFSYEDEEYVNAFAFEKLQLDEEKARQWLHAWNALPIGYGMLSLNAIRKINRFLEKGYLYTEAVLLANVPAVIGEDIWSRNENEILLQIKNVIGENRWQKAVLNVVNTLVSRYKNLEQKFGYKNNEYLLDDSDRKEVLESILEAWGERGWSRLSEQEKAAIVSAVTDCYQAYFRSSGLMRRDIDGERFFRVESDGNTFYKSDSGFYRMPKLSDTFSDYLSLSLCVPVGALKNIYHPSDLNIYAPAKDAGDGVIKLGSPKTGAFKNPMAMRALHELRKLINYFIETQQVDSETRVVVEVARELNDANKRWAIEAWQRQREAENDEFAKAIEELVKQNGVLASGSNSKDVDKMRLWYEQNSEEAVPPVADIKKEVKGMRWAENRKNSYKQIAAQKSMIDKYRLWKEQDCRCIYTGKIISISDLFNENVIDFEHTIPRSLSFDNSLANQTVCYADYNRTVKKKKIPYVLDNYDAIKVNIEKWVEKVERIKQQVDFWRTKSRKATDKSWKDDAIRQRHLWQMELDYWQNKVNRFCMQEVTTGFKNSQKVDTQLISKYAFHYLKSYFDKVDVQKGSITAEFRKIYGLQSVDKVKDRSEHSHHAKDAAVLTLIPVAAKRDEILKSYYEHKESSLAYKAEPYRYFKREHVWAITDNVVIQNIAKDQTLSVAKKVIRKRGKEVKNDIGDKKWATGDSVRGQLHLETFYGAIKPAKKGLNGELLKDEDGKFIQDDKVRYVVRVPFQYKKDQNSPGFKTLEEIEKLVVDDGLKRQIRKQVLEASDLKDAFDKGIFMFDKHGRKQNQIRHIRVWANISDPLKVKMQTNLSKADYKQHYYAGNASNSYFAIYAGEGRTDYEYRNLMDTAKMMAAQGVKRPEDLFEPSMLVKKGKKEYLLNLRYILAGGKKVIFTKEEEEDVSELPLRDLIKRLYVFTNFEKDGRLNFKYHLEARNKIDETYSESDIDFEKPKPTLRFSYSKYTFLVEGYEFEVKMDGELFFYSK